EWRLAAGGKVLFLPRNADLDWSSPAIDTVPVFWNRQMGPNWSRMLGLWVNTRHDALASFPTQANFHWQWSEILGTSVNSASAGSPGAAGGNVCSTRAINLDRLRREVQPIVQVIDDWNRNYKLGLIFECRVGQGRLMVCAVDLESSLEARPAAR